MAKRIGTNCFEKTVVLYKNLKKNFEVILYFIHEIQNYLIKRKKFEIFFLNDILKYSIKVSVINQ